MRKLVSFMHISLDGFVGGLNGELDWITHGGEIFDYAQDRTSQSDTALYGRATYQIMQDYWPTAADAPDASKHDIEHAKWYAKVKKVILSRTWQGREIPNTTIISNSLAENINAVKNQEGKEIVIFGSPGATHSLMLQDLIDEYWFFVNPIILGKGITLFRGNEERINLRLIKTRAFSSGVVCLHYERKK